MPFTLFRKFFYQEELEGFPLFPEKRPESIPRSHYRCGVRIPLRECQEPPDFPLFRERFILFNLVRSNPDNVHQFVFLVRTTSRTRPRIAGSRNLCFPIFGYEVTRRSGAVGWSENVQFAGQFTNAPQFDEF